MSFCSKLCNSIQRVSPAPKEAGGRPGHNLEILHLPRYRQHLLLNRLWKEEVNH